MRFGFGFGFGSQLLEYIPIFGSSRYFTDLASVSAQYYTIPSITLSGDFEVEGKFTTVGASTQVLIGSTTSHYVAQVSNSWNVSIAGVTSNFGSSVAEQDGKLHTYKLTRVGSTTEFFIDGVSRGTTGTQTGTLTLSNIGSNPTFYWPGVLADVKIWKDGDRNTGTLKRFYKIDEDLSVTSTIKDYGSDGSDGTAINSPVSEKYKLDGINWIGLIDHITNGGFDTDTSWSKGTGWSISGGLATHATGTRSNLIQALSGFIEGETVRVIYDIVSGTDNAGVVSVQGGGSAFGAIGTVNYVFDETVGNFAGGGMKFDAFMQNDVSIDNVKLFKRLEIAQ